jgi:osmotically-inducible protein OsmY
LLHGLVARDKPGKAATPAAGRVREAVITRLRGTGMRTVFINVVVADGVVHLWGWAGSATERKAVALAARRTPGVKRVVNHLSVEPVSTFGME